jgi:hypothetical protein
MFVSLGSQTRFETENVKNQFCCDILQSTGICLIPVQQLQKLVSERIYTCMVCWYIKQTQFTALNALCRMAFDNVRIFTLGLT